jgi:hypothetical protein
LTGAIEVMATRRTALLGGVAVALASAVGSWRPALARLPSTAEFTVLRDGDRIGRGTMTFVREGDDLRVALVVEAKVKLGFITLFHYRHDAEEVWRAGRLAAVRSFTDDDGEKRHVVGRAEPGGFVVDGPSGRVVAPVDVLPSSYWHPDTVRQTTLLDVSKGRVRRIVVDRLADESLSVAGRAVLANRYALTGDLKAGLWYGSDGTWLKTSLQKKGSDIDLVLNSAPVLAVSDLQPALAGRGLGSSQPRQLAAANDGG